MGGLLASSKDRTKTDPPEKGQHMSPRPQKCCQPPSIASAWQDRPNPAEPCQVPHGSHLLLWATTSAQTRASLVLRIWWTRRDFSPGHIVLLLFPRESEVFAAGPVAGREGFCLFPCWAGYWDHPPKHKAQAGPAQGPYVRNRKDSPTNSPWKLLRSASRALITYSSGTSPGAPCRQHLPAKDTGSIASLQRLSI